MDNVWIVFHRDEDAKRDRDVLDSVFNTEDKAHERAQYIRDNTTLPAWVVQSKVE